MNNKEDAKAAAQRMVESQRVAVEERRIAIQESLKQIAEASPQNGGFEEIAVLLALPDEHFNLLGPIFLAELEKSYDNTNDKLILVESMNVAGLKAEDARAEYYRICQLIDENMGQILSYQKRPETCSCCGS